MLGTLLIKELIFLRVALPDSELRMAVSGERVLNFESKQEVNKSPITMKWQCGIEIWGLQTCCKRLGCKVLVYVFGWSLRTASGSESYDHDKMILLISSLRAIAKKIMPRHFSWEEEELKEGWQALPLVPCSYVQGPSPFYNRNCGPNYGRWISSAQECRTLRKIFRTL